MQGEKSLLEQGLYRHAVRSQRRDTENAQPRHAGARRYPAPLHRKMQSARGICHCGKRRASRSGLPPSVCREPAREPKHRMGAVCRYVRDPQFGIKGACRNKRSRSSCREAADALSPVAGYRRGCRRIPRRTGQAARCYRKRFSPAADKAGRLSR